MKLIKTLSHYYEIINLTKPSLVLILYAEARRDSIGPNYSKFEFYIFSTQIAEAIPVGQHLSVDF